MAVEPEVWSHRLCAIEDLPEEGEARVAEAGERQIAIFRVSGQLYAVDDICTHAHSSLAEDGYLCDLVIECALHQARFSLETGAALSGPTKKPLRHYALELEGTDVIATEQERAPVRRGL